MGDALMHACAHAYMRTCTHADVHTCTHAHMHTCTHAHMHTIMHTIMHTCTHAHMHTCTRAHVHTHVHMHARAHARTCTGECQRIARGSKLDPWVNVLRGDEKLRSMIVTLRERATQAWRHRSVSSAIIQSVG